MKKLLFSFLLFIFHFSFFTVHAQTWQWGRQGTHINNANDRCIAADAKGNAFMAGTFTDSITFGNQHLTSLTSQGEAYLVKYDSSGNQQWVKQSVSASSASLCTQSYVTADAAGNSYIAGNFFDTVSFGSNKLISKSVNTGDMFVVKYDPNGNVLWAKQTSSYVVDSSSGAEAWDVEVDKAGNVYVSGDFTDSVLVGGTIKLTNPNGPGTTAGLLAKYNSNGNLLWAQGAKTASSASSSSNYALALDAFRSVYVAVTFSDSVYYAASTLITPSAPGTVALIKYDTAGGLLWSRQSNALSSSSTSYSVSVVADNAGNAYMAGAFTDTLSFPPYTINTDTNGGIFLAKYSANGNMDWVKQSKGTANYAYVAIDSLNNIYFTGCVPGTTDTTVFCGDSIAISNPTDDAFIMKMDTAAHPDCITVFRSSTLASVACNAAGKYVYVSGQIDDTITFNTDLLHGDTNNYEPYTARWKPCATIPLAVNNIPQSESAVLYPNPNKGIFTVSLRHAELVSASHPKVEIYSALGEKVFDATLKQVQGDNSINISDQNAGIYFYRIIGEEGKQIATGRFIIQK
jgi:hypothetical protein